MWGQWKSSTRVSDVHDDMDILHPDAKGVVRLCIGGPCKHVVKENSSATNNFILEHVVPNVHAHCEDDRVPLVLGKAFALEDALTTQQ